MKLAELKKEFEKITAKLSRALSKEATLGDYAVGLSFARSVEKTFKSDDPTSITSLCKTKIIEVVKAQGRKKPDAASTVYAAAGWAFSMYPSKTGTDPRKVQARLMAKLVESGETFTDPMRLVKKYMKMVPTYDLDPALTFRMVKDGIMTEKDLKDCEYDESWTLKTPTEVE